MRIDDWFDSKIFNYRSFLSYWINSNQDNPTKFPLSMEESRWQEEFENWQKAQQSIYDEE